MRTETITRTLYEYDELSESAKEKVKKWLLEGRESGDFQEVCEDELAYMFPNSNLKVEFSLTYCQGDGLNIYGDLNLMDALEKVKSKFSEKEIKFLTWAFKHYDAEFDMPCNFRNAYSICDEHDYTGEVLNDMDIDRMRYGKEQEEALEKFNRVIGDYLTELCKEFEHDGYDYFYEIDEDEVRELVDICEYEFTEDGMIA